MQSRRSPRAARLPACAAAVSCVAAASYEARDSSLQPAVAQLLVGGKTPGLQTNSLVGDRLRRLLGRPQQFQVAAQRAPAGQPRLWLLGRGRLRRQRVEPAPRLFQRRGRAHHAAPFEVAPHERGGREEGVGAHT